MSETMKAFLEYLNQNPALKDELDALATADTGQKQTSQAKNEIISKTIEIATLHGFTLTDDDFPGTSAQLSEDQLFAATGGTGGESVQGGFCGCFGGGYGGGLGLTGEGWCMCPWAGFGYDGAKFKDIPDKENWWCSCNFAGGGGTGPEG